MTHVDRLLPPVRTLLGVWAHPDDEAYLSSALMAAVRREGARVVVVTATHGEHGTGDPVPLRQSGQPTLPVRGVDARATRTAGTRGVLLYPFHHALVEVDPV